MVSSTHAAAHGTAVAIKQTIARGRQRRCGSAVHPEAARYRDLLEESGQFLDLVFAGAELSGFACNGAERGAPRSTTVGYLEFGFRAVTTAVPMTEIVGAACAALPFVPAGRAFFRTTDACCPLTAGTEVTTGWPRLAPPGAVIFAVAPDAAAELSFNVWLNLVLAALPEVAA